MVPVSLVSSLLLQCYLNVVVSHKIINQFFRRNKSCFFELSVLEGQGGRREWIWFKLRGDMKDVRLRLKEG